MRKIEVLGIKINLLTFSQAIKIIEQFISIGRPKQIITANPEFIMTAQKDPEFASIINGADLVVPDGTGLVWTIKFLYHQTVEKITGVDLVDKISQLASKKGYAIFLLGGKEGVAKKTAKKLKEKYPLLKIAGYFAGKPQIGYENLPEYNFPFDIRITDIKKGRKDPNWEIIKKIRLSRADILLVAYGHPKQDKFINRYKKALGVPVMIGVGGTFDYLTGEVSRAPLWMQNMGLEWFWRLIHQPWRWKRIYTAVIKFPLAILFSKKS